MARREEEKFYSLLFSIGINFHIAVKNGYLHDEIDYLLLSFPFNFFFLFFSFHLACMHAVNEELKSFVFLFFLILVFNTKIEN